MFKSTQLRQSWTQQQGVCDLENKHHPIAKGSVLITLAVASKTSQAPTCMYTQMCTKPISPQI